MVYIMANTCGDEFWLKPLENTRLKRGYSSVFTKAMSMNSSIGCMLRYDMYWKEYELILNISHGKAFINNE